MPGLLNNRLPATREELAEFCRKHHIRRLSFFGSVVRDDFGPDSDVDVLMEFEPGQTPGYAIIRIEDELSALLGGRNVDVINPKYINHRLKDRILEEAQVQYEER